MTAMRLAHGRALRQRGVALIIMLTVLIMGVAWFTVGALGKSAITTAERDVKSKAALQAAKKAVLGYIASNASRGSTIAYKSQATNFTIGSTLNGATSGATATIAADSDSGSTGTLTLKSTANSFIDGETITDSSGGSAVVATATGTDVPGQMPCPELLTSIGGVYEGIGGGGCSNAIASIGRLPWRTLGIDQLRDGYGEPLWYVLSPGYRLAPLNFGTSANLPYDSTSPTPNVVAVIIAPGSALNTTSASGTPSSDCARVSQQSNRYTSPLDKTNFLECGNATGTSTYPYSNPAPTSATWSNDRVIEITANEWADAIAGGVADRIQRQVAPAMNSWRTTDSIANWGISFMPYAATFGDPTASTFCGVSPNWEGLMPVARLTNTQCSPWTVGAGTYSGTAQGLTIPIGGTTCSLVGTSIKCTFVGVLLAIGTIEFHVSIRALNVANSFRAGIAASQFTVSSVPAGAFVSNITNTLDAAGGFGTVTFDVSNCCLLATSFSVTVTPPQDAALLSDSRMKWFLDNNWNQYTYYASSPSSTANPTAVCNYPATTTGCLTANGLASATGYAGDKKLVLVYMGRRLSTQPSTCSSVGNCLEGDNASTTDRSYANAVTTSTFNDKLAVCPYQVTPASGTSTVICSN